METTYPSSTNHSRRRHVGFIVGMVSSAMVLIGTALGAVTVGRGPINTSLSVGQLSNDGHLFIVVMLVLAVGGLLIARDAHRRLVAVVATIAFSLIVGAVFYTYAQADNPSGVVATVATDLANPRPSVGFYLILIGAVAGLIGSIVMLADRDR